MPQTKPKAPAISLPIQPEFSCIALSIVPTVAANKAQDSITLMRLKLNLMPAITVTSSPARYSLVQCTSAILKNTTTK